MTAAVNITKMIDENPIGALQWRVAGLCFLVAVLDGFDMQAMAFAAPAVATIYDIDPAQMGAILSAALVGLMLGALLFGPMADKIGRKPIIIGACIVMGVFSLLTVTASSAGEFIAYRFLTGLGLGAAMPTLNTLTSEYAPSSRRAFLITAMFVGVPIGNVIGGFFAAAAIGPLGWQSVFWVGGIGPILLIPILMLFLPESVQFLTKKSPNDARIASLASAIDRETTYSSDHQFEVADQKAPAGRVRDLFTEGRAGGTLLIWGVFFANLLMTFSLISWLPSVLRMVGFPLERALYMSAASGLGAMVGGLVIAWLADKHGFGRVLMVGAIGASLSLAVLGFATFSLPSAVAAVIIAGIFVGGLQFGLQALAVSFYPLRIRSTGMGWAFAVGRVGAILGPLAMGVLLAREWQVETVFLLIAAPGLFSAYCIARLQGRMKSIEK